MYGFVGLFLINLVIGRFTCGLPEEQKKMAALYDELKAKKQI